MQARLFLPPSVPSTCAQCVPCECKCFVHLLEVGFRNGAPWYSYPQSGLPCSPPGFEFGLGSIPPSPCSSLPAPGMFHLGRGVLLSGQVGREQVLPAQTREFRYWCSVHAEHNAIEKAGAPEPGVGTVCGFREPVLAWATWSWGTLSPDPSSCWQPKDQPRFSDRAWHLQPPTCPQGPRGLWAKFPLSHPQGSWAPSPESWVPGPAASTLHTAAVWRGCRLHARADLGLENR